jgi:hypothetical protein
MQQHFLYYNFKLVKLSSDPWAKEVISEPDLLSRLQNDETTKSCQLLPLEAKWNGELYVPIIKKSPRTPLRGMKCE